MTDEPARLEAYLDRHLRFAWTDDLDGLVADYADDAVLFTPDGPVVGKPAIRRFLADFMNNKPRGFPDDIEFLRRDFAADTIYIVWSCGPDIPFATETFVLRGDKIAVQSFAACPLAHAG